MRLHVGLFIAGAVSAVHAASSEASVYIFKEKSTSFASHDLPSLSPETARLVLADRLGLSRYHSLLGADELTIKNLNQFGGSRNQQFLSDDPEWTHRPGRVLLVIEGVENPQVLIDPTTMAPAFTIQNPPSSAHNLQLVEDLLTQDRDRRHGSSSCSFRTPNGAEIRGGIDSDTTHTECALDVYFHGVMSQKKDSVSKLESLGAVIVGDQRHSSPDHTAIFHIASLEISAQRDGLRSSVYTDTLSAIKTHLAILQSHTQLPNQEAIIILMPPTSTISKRSVSSYGTYSVPSHSHLTRQYPSESPLSIPKPSSSNSSPKPSHPKTFKASSKKIPDICYPTVDALNNATSHCSHHGTAYRKYTTPTGIDCIACQCGVSKRVNADGTIKTTRWGGAACQKKDVSFEFWLIAGFTVSMVAAVTWAVGLLFSIGMEDLPSVIGAGVAGPRATK